MGRQEIAIHSFVDEHGQTNNEPVLVRVSDWVEPVCDLSLVQQLEDVGGSIAIIRDGHLGDLLMLTPTIRALKQEFPALGINILCSESFTRVFKGNPYVESCDKISMAAIKKFVYTIDLRGYVERVSDAHTVDRISLFSQAFGVTVEAGTPDFVVDEEDREKARQRLTRYEGKPVIVLAPDASDQRRCIPGSFVFDFSRKIAQHGFAVFVTGPERGEYPSLGELGAIVEQAAAVVCGDNGVYHLAAAFGTHSFPMFSTIDPKLRCSWYSNCHPLLSARDCAPCFEKYVRDCSADCLGSIEADCVVAKVIETVN